MTLGLIPHQKILRPPCWYIFVQKLLIRPVAVGCPLEFTENRPVGSRVTTADADKSKPTQTICFRQE